MQMIKCKRQENHDSSKVHEKEQGEREQRKKKEKNFCTLRCWENIKWCLKTFWFDLGKKLQMCKYASHSTNTCEDHSGYE